jgi:hypothetical protein
MRNEDRAQGEDLLSQCQTEFCAAVTLQPTKSETARLLAGPFSSRSAKTAWAASALFESTPSIF